MHDSIYTKPQAYELEHEGDTRDVEFYCALVQRYRAARVLELACGSGRVTIPIAVSGAKDDVHVTGIDVSAEMLEEARRRAASIPPAVQERVSLLREDMRTWAADAPFDLILVPCCSVAHLLTLEDQLAVWFRARDNLRAGGRFAVEIAMPDLRTFAESLETPPRALVQMDIDSTDSVGSERLIRYKATYYAAHEQRARIHFFYDRFDGEAPVDRFVSDFQSHVYYPRELELLFRYTGFEIDAVYGDFAFRPVRASSRTLIMVGRKPLPTPAAPGAEGER